MTKCEKLVATEKNFVALATPMVAMSSSDYENIIYYMAGSMSRQDEPN